MKYEAAEIYSFSTREATKPVQSARAIALLLL
jgi:hypothetical protein